MESRGRRGWRTESSQGEGAGGQRAVREEGLEDGEREQSGRSPDLSSLKPVQCGFIVSRKEVETTTKNAQE